MNHSEYVAGRTLEKSLIAIIRFSTDRAEIDDDGLRVLSTLFSNFRILLDDYRVQFTCLGLADRRAARIMSIWACAGPLRSRTTLIVCSDFCQITAASPLTPLENY